MAPIIYFRAKICLSRGSIPIVAGTPMSSHHDASDSEIMRSGAYLVASLRRLRRTSALAGLALVLTLGLLATACAPFGAEDERVAVEPTAAPPVVDTAASADPPEPEDPESPEPAEGTPSPEPAESSPADDQVKEPEPVSGGIDLGEFNDYEPADADLTRLSVDEEIFIGTLDNGLTYYLRSNDTPAEGVEMRLVVNAGAILDPDGADGVAHYLEHMLFNGTERFSKNDLIQALRSIGTDFGPDLNAYTSADETVYMFDFLLDNPEALDLAFEVLSQWLSAATLQPDDVEAERGIVLDEYRLRR